MHLKDYLFYRLTGKITTDATDQSLIFLNQETGIHGRAFAVCGLENTGEVSAGTAGEGKMRLQSQGEAAQELGLPEDVLVTSGPMDVSACALGSGVTEAGQCCSIMGTAALHEMVLDKPLQDDIRGDDDHARDGGQMAQADGVAGGDARI